MVKVDSVTLVVSMKNSASIANPQLSDSIVGALSIQVPSATSPINSVAPSPVDVSSPVSSVVLVSPPSELVSPPPEPFSPESISSSESPVSF